MNIRTHLLCFRLRYWSRQTNRYWFSASIHRQLKPISVQWPLPSSAFFSPLLLSLCWLQHQCSYHPCICHWRIIPVLWHVRFDPYRSRNLIHRSIIRFHYIFFFYHFSFLRIFLSRWSSPRNLKLKTIPLPLSNALCSMLTVRNLYIFRQLFYPFISEGCPWHSILRLGSAPVRSQDCRWQPERNTNYRVQWKRHRHHHG